MPDLVQGAEGNISRDSFDAGGDQFEEQEEEEDEGELEDGGLEEGGLEEGGLEEGGGFDDWEGVELERLATIREEEERWGFTQTRELEKELEDQGEDGLDQTFQRLDLTGSRPMQPAFHYVKGNDTLEFEQLERSLLCQDSTRRGKDTDRVKFERRPIPEEEDYVGECFEENPFRTSKQLLRTIEKPFCAENVESDGNMSETSDGHVNEDVEGVWHLDEDGAKVASAEELDLAAWLETERKALEQLLGEEKLVRLYQVVAMMEEEEEEEDMEAGWEEVARVVGSKEEELVERVINLVIADTHFMNSE